MHFEIPVINICYSCFPVRVCLLAYAYLKLTVISLWVFLWYAYYGPVRLEGIWIDIFIVVAIDVAMTVVLIGSAYKKNPRLLKAYIWYSIVQMALLVLFQIYALTRMGIIGEHVIISSAFLVVVQLYLIFPIRREFFKLESQADIVPVDERFKSETV